MMPTMPAGADVPINIPEDGAVKMPFVTGGAPGVAARINEAVWREELDGTVAPTTPGKTFTPRPDKLPVGTSTLTYVAKTTPRLLSLDISSEGCGAYCEQRTITRVFDLRDGREIAIGDLLTVDGFAVLAHRVDAERRHAYQEQVRELRAALKSAPKGKKKDDDDDNAERLALNEDCLKRVESGPATPDWLVELVFALDGHGGLALSMGRCANHMNAALDDVGELTIQMTAADLQPSLTSYGATIVQGQGDAPPPPPGFAGRVLHGRLAGMPITMSLDPPREGVETHGTYQYDKFHTPIALSVRQEGRTLRAVEQAESHGELELRAQRRHAGGHVAGQGAPQDAARDPAVMRRHATGERMVDHVKFGVGGDGGAFAR